MPTSKFETGRLSFRMVTLASALASALIACAHGGGNGEGWVVQASPNARVFGPRGVDVRNPQMRVETTASLYRATFFKNLPAKPFDVVVLDDVPGALTRVGLPGDRPPGSWSLERLPSGAEIGRDGLIIVVYGSYGGIAKQVAYQMINRAIPNAPLWLRLGFSEYLANFDTHLGDKESNHPNLVCFGPEDSRPLVAISHQASSEGFSYPLVEQVRQYNAPRGLNGQPLSSAQMPTPLPDVQPWTGTRSAPSYGVLLPIANVLPITWADYSRESPKWQEFTAYVFVHHLIHGHPQGLARFKKMLNGLTEGLPTEEALVAAYPTLRFDQIDQQLQLYTHGAPEAPYYTPATNGLCKSMPADTGKEQATTSPAPTAEMRATLNEITRLPIWRDPMSWYPVDALRSRGGFLRQPTPVESQSLKPESDRGGGTNRLPVKFTPPS